MNLISLNEVQSTNTYLRQLIESEKELEEYTIVDCYAQTKGRGQRGNSWESNPGENLSCSVLLHPSEVAHPFDLNIIVSLAVRDLLSEYIKNKEIWIKWPNDLLVGERKIAGILIENEWLGMEWKYSIVGVGLNVCQERFGEYTPAATSFNIEGVGLPSSYKAWHNPLLEKLVNSIKDRRDQLLKDTKELRRIYHQHLLGYQRERKYRLPNGKEFFGIIQEVLPNGLLSVKTEEGISLYAFKEIATLF